MKTSSLIMNCFCFCCVLITSLIATACDRTSNAGKDKLEFEEFTQCGVPSNPGLAFKSLYLDTQRKCYGTRWRIPAAYLIDKGATPGRNLETVFLSIILPGFTPGPRQRFELFSEVRVREEMRDWGNSPEEIVYNAPTAPVSATGEVVRNMVVFQRFDSVYQNLVFVPKDRSTYFMYCHVSKRKNYKSGEDFLKARDERAACRVKQKVGKGLYATYYVQHKLLKDMAEIADGMEALIGRFIID